MPKRAQEGPRPCIFCGPIRPPNKMSEEHLLASWLRDLLPDRSGVATESRVIYGDRNSSLPSDAKQRVRQGTIKNKRIRVVCKKCNESWMRALDKHGGETEWVDKLIRSVGGRPLPSGEDLDPATFPHKIQMVTWGIGKLRLVVASTNDMDHYRNRKWAIPNMIPLWPPDIPDFIWPPSGPPISDRRMDDIAELIVLGRSMTGGRSPFR